MSMEKYVGRTIMIVYVDKKEQFSQRVIRVVRIESGTVFAFDVAKRQPRTFEAARILAARPVKRRAS
ncbi:hypothetical protein ACF3MZ_12080 [Paenibacillaceae bacterium WGS1546]|uniref:hypothetical protein n=1 Tax=Cohnella sp. WGS1546 TaxID=3366810 RepID=UPI00372D497A